MTAVSLVGNLVADPELRFTPSGCPVAVFTVAATPRYQDKTGTWRDGDTVFLRCIAWRGLAEHAAETLRRGMRVIACGQLRQRSYATRDGQRRSMLELELTEVGPSLKWATARVTKTSRASTDTPPAGDTSPADPWATPTEPAASTIAPGPAGEPAPPF